MPLCRLASGRRSIPHSVATKKQSAGARSGLPRDNGRSAVIKPGFRSVAATIGVWTVARATVAAAAFFGAAFACVEGESGAAQAAEQWNFYMHQSAPNFATSR